MDNSYANTQDILEKVKSINCKLAKEQYWTEWAWNPGKLKLNWLAKIVVAVMDNYNNT
jgi:hypothetical protein